jgi:DNA polymerase III epsilon subunit-like protein
MKKIDPYSENLVFMDTEFSSLNPYKGEILSIGLIKLDGQELYLELEHEGEVDPWVEKNILPHLKEEKVGREVARKEIKKFVGSERPYLLAYVNQFDAIYWYKLFGIENHPAHWIPLDFASMLFALGLDPEGYYHEDKSNFFEEIGVDHTKYRKHNALDDAKLLKEVYLKLIKTGNFC